MTRRWYNIAVLLMWLALPAAAWNYWSVWDRLPGRMAVHFDANWQPNGFTSREGALELGLGIMVVMLVLFTVATLILYAMKPVAALPGLVVAYVVVGFCWYGNYSIVKFNLKRSSQCSVVSTQSSVLSSQSPEPARFDWELTTEN